MRSIDNIYQTLLESFRERAGFAPDSGCDLAVRLWAAAAEIQALELQAAWVLDQCFPQTAPGPLSRPPWHDPRSEPYPRGQGVRNPPLLRGRPCRPQYPHSGRYRRHDRRGSPVPDHCRGYPPEGRAFTWTRPRKPLNPEAAAMRSPARCAS